ncbi:MAG: cation diffusion facilitator family transporter [Janthinobacterium lividum]
MDIKNPAHLEILVKRATYASVSVAFILIIAKFLAWIATGSLSLQATLVDSLLDAAASVLNLFAVRQAYRPPDREHRFGHGKIEAIAALGQSIFVVASAAWLLSEASGRLVQPQKIESMNLGILVMVFAIVITLVLIAYQNYVIGHTNSTAIMADSVHYRSDLLINGSVIVALLGSEWFGNGYLDSFFSVVISIYILMTAWKIAKNSFHILIDRELVDEDREKIIAIALSHPKVLGCHDLRTRSSGSRHFIQCHIEMDGTLSLHEAHVISEEVSSTIEAQFTQAEVIIHEDAYRENRESQDPFLKII